jgi:hypothetical protein
VTQLDVADIVVIAGRVLGIGTDAALAQADLDTARTALAALPAPPRPGPARPRPARPGRDSAATGAVALIRALLEHPPFPRHREVVAVASGLQYLSVNGWHADLDPPGTAVVVVEALASGRLGADAAVAWLEPRLSRRRRALAPRRPRGRAPVGRTAPAPRRSGVLATTAVLAAAGGLTLLATACAHGPMTTIQLSYTTCMRSHGLPNFPGPSASGVIVVDASTGLSPAAAKVRSAQRACANDAPPTVKWPAAQSR